MYDVIIIGAGISGASIAFELSKFEGKVLLLEKENDVANGTSKANSGILHAGYDPDTGTLMAQYNVAGNTICKQLCKDLDVLCKQIGSLVVAFKEADKSTLQKMYKRGVANGVEGLRIIQHDELMQMEENLSADAVEALYAPSACIVNPWELVIALAETAVKNGVECKLQEQVVAIKKIKDCFVVQTNHHTYRSRTIVNAAGVACDKITEMLKEADYHMKPTKGEYYLMDKSQGNLVHHVIFQCPNEMGKGTLVAPTVHGNLIVGPSSTYCLEDDLATTKEGLQMVKEKAIVSIPKINFRETIRTFSGIRAKREDHGDFIIGEDHEIEGFFQIAAMQSPGLTSAPAIAKAMVKDFQKKELFVVAKDHPIVTRKIVRFNEMNTEERMHYIHAHPTYGRIICRCEMISEGEILDALHRVITPVSFDAIKRRCNTGMGRCQGGFCGPKVQALIARELHMEIEDVVLDKEGSRILWKKTKEGGYR